MHDLASYIHHHTHIACCLMVLHISSDFFMLGVHVVFEKKGISSLALLAKLALHAKAVKYA